MKKSLLSLLLGVLMLIPGYASAVTEVSDIVGKNCAIFAKELNITAPFLTQRSNCAVVEKGNGTNEIILRNFMGIFDLPATLNSDGTLSFNTIGKTYPCKGEYAGWTAEFGKKNFVDAYNYVQYNAEYVGYGERFTLTTASFSSDAITSRTEENMLGCEVRNDNSGAPVGFYIKMTNSAGTVSLNTYGSFEFLFYDTNSVATEYAHNGTTKKYAVRTIIDKTNRKISFDNLFDKGRAYINTVSGNYSESTTKSIDATYDANGNFTIEPQEVGGRVVGYNLFYQQTCNIYNYDSYWDEFYFNKSLYGECWEVEGDTYLDHYNLCNTFGPKDEDCSGITGKYYDAPRHEGKGNYWVKAHGGAISTFDSEKIVLDHGGIYSLYIDNFYAEADKIEINISEHDITHDVQMTVNKFDVASQGDQVYASVTIDSRVNNDYIESYDLYFVPGTYTSAADANFKHHDEKGHSDAILIEEGIIPMATFAANGDHGYTLDINKGVPEVVNIPNRKKGAPYTLFLKANYNNGLHPTFHALATPQGTVTGLEELEAQECVKVEVVTGGLNVTGESNVEVYTTAGTLVYNGQAGNIELAAGLYIVRIGNHIEKVLVK